MPSLMLAKESINGVVSVLEFTVPFQISSASYFTLGEESD